MNCKVVASHDSLGAQNQFFMSTLSCRIIKINSRQEHSNQRITSHKELGLEEALSNKPLYSFLLRLSQSLKNAHVFIMN
jgi:hypothetical protein